jgi:hypothetical protein
MKLLATFVASEVVAATSFTDTVRANFMFGSEARAQRVDGNQRVRKD